MEMSPSLAQQPGSIVPSVVFLQKTCQSQAMLFPPLGSLSVMFFVEAAPPARAPLIFKHKPRPVQGAGRGLWWRHVAAYFFRYSSTGLSFGLFQADLVASLAGRPTLVFFGGIGCTNHLS